MSMTKAQFLRLLRAAHQVADERGAAASVGADKFRRGLANEGYDGGYAAAMSDIEALLIHGYPTDARHLWADAAARIRRQKDTAP